MEEGPTFTWKLDIGTTLNLINRCKCVSSMHENLTQQLNKSPIIRFYKIKTQFASYNDPYSSVCLMTSEKSVFIFNKYIIEFFLFYFILYYNKVSIFKT